MIKSYKEEYIPGGFITTKLKSVNYISTKIVIDKLNKILQDAPDPVREFNAHIQFLNTEINNFIHDLEKENERT